MFETPFTVVGTIVTDPVHRRVGDAEVMKFRVASNSRRRGADGEWEQGNSLFVNVNCWGRLVTGVAGTLTKGDPVVVVGHLYTSEYEDRDGNRRSAVEVRATAVGPDVARATVRVEKPRRAGAEAGSPEIESQAVEATDRDRLADDDAAGDDGGGERPDEGLALSA